MKPGIEIILGSESDEKAFLGSMARAVFEHVGYPWQEHMSIISAHRHPDPLADFLNIFDRSDPPIFICGVGMNGALPGTISAYFKGCCVVLGVPLTRPAFAGLDSLLSISQMPKGIPVSCHSSDKAGFTNAAIQACWILGYSNQGVHDKVYEFQMKNMMGQPQIHYNPLEKKEE